MKQSFTEHWTNDCDFTIHYTKHLHSEKSPYQQIDFYESKTFGRFFTLDDLMMITEKDEFMYHDMISHIPMAVNPNIKRVLIIGGGDGGTAREISRYQTIETIDMVEIDERVVRLCEQFIPQTAHALSTDPRIHVRFEDGVLFVKNTPDETYDLILVDSTDPIGPGEGLFSKEFYQNCYRILSKDGILINQHESPFFDLQKLEMKRSHSKIKELFEQVHVYHFHQTIYPSGYWLFGFASKQYHPINDHKPEVWETNHLETKYYNSNIHKAAFMLPTYVIKELTNE